MKLGKVYLDLQYIVDLEDENMVGYAKDAIVEDIMNTVRLNEIHIYLKTKPTPRATIDDIPYWLKLEKDNQLEIPFE